MTRLLLLAACGALASTPAAAGCLAYGDKSATLTGKVYAFEAFDEAEADSVGRTRELDYYALVLPERVCVAGRPNDPRRPAHYVTIVRLDLPAARAKALLQREVRVMGPLSASRGDPAVVMKVKRVLGPSSN